MASTTLTFLNTNSGAIQAVATVVLVFITYWYARLTRSAVNEAASARLDARLPIIEPLELRGPIKNSNKGKRLEIHLKNIGYGPALDIRLILPKKTQQNIDNFAEEDTGWYEIPLAEEDEQKFAELPKLKKEIYIKYYDVFGREIVTLMLFDVNNHSNGLEKWASFSIDTWHLFMPNEHARGLLMPSSYMEDLVTPTEF